MLPLGNALAPSTKDDDVELFLENCWSSASSGRSQAEQLHPGHNQNHSDVTRDLESLRTNYIKGYKIEEMCFPSLCSLSWQTKYFSFM